MRATQNLSEYGDSFSCVVTAFKGEKEPLLSRDRLEKSIGGTRTVVRGKSVLFSNYNRRIGLVGTPLITDKVCLSEDCGESNKSSLE